MFQNRVALLMANRPSGSARILNSCCAPFVAAPAQLVGAVTESQQTVYAEAWNAARKQIAQRSLLTTWNCRSN